MAKQTFTTGQVLTAAQMTSLQQTAMLGGAASAKTASYTLVSADAGTAISMSNAGATTITVNTGLFEAGDTIQITNLGAGICTITAGTATVNTASSLELAQYESGTLDFTSASEAVFIKAAGPAAGGGGGKVLQVVNATTSTNTNIATTTYTDTTITATITPTLDTSKILVIISAQFLTYSSSSVAYVDSKAKLMRGATDILTNNLMTQSEGASANISLAGSYSLTFLDSPATTSATTYKVQAAKLGSGTGVNYQAGGNNTSVITLLEIGV